MELRCPYSGGDAGRSRRTQPYADDGSIGYLIPGSQGRLTRVQVDLDVLQAGNVVAASLAESLGKPLPWAGPWLAHLGSVDDAKGYESVQDAPKGPIWARAVDPEF